MSVNEEVNIEDFEKASKEIDDIMVRYDIKTRNKLVTRALSTWLASIDKNQAETSDNPEENVNGDGDNLTEPLDDPIMSLDRIVKFIKPKVPRSGILPSETLIQPVKDEETPDVETIEIDGFLYDDEDLDRLEDEGELSRYYCEECGSKKIKFLNTASSSMSREELFNLFNDTLPILPDKTVVDVGSRLGAVLYGAYVFTDAPKIIGVEMNKEFCDIQNEVINAFKMKDRVTVINKKIQDVEDVLESADVVVINNVFDSYLPKEKHAELWYFFRAHIQKGAYIACRPSIESAVYDLKLNIDAMEWVKKVDSSFEEIINENSTETSKLNFPNRSGIFCYQVL